MQHDVLGLRCVGIFQTHFKKLMWCDAHLRAPMQWVESPVWFTPSSLALFMLNRKEVMNHAHLFVVMVSVQVQIGPLVLSFALLPRSHTLSLSLSPLSLSLSLEKSQRK